MADDLTSSKPGISARYTAPVKSPWKRCAASTCASNPANSCPLSDRPAPAKSTLFHIIGGLTPPTSGSVRVGSLELAQLSDGGRTKLRAGTVSFVFQKFNLLPNLTASENIELARYFSGRSSAADGAQFAEILEKLGIAHRLNHLPSELSGGEQQRVAIARALVNQPAILLADEPTGNLDSVNSDAVLKILRNLNDRTGQTILMITHNPDAAAYGHRIVHMRDGAIVNGLTE